MVTLRQLIVSAVECAHNIDRPVVVRFIRRTADGGVVSLRTVAVARVFDGHTLTVEMADYDEALEEKP